MAVERVFLGWDGPALPRAARWLRERYADSAGLDLSAVTVVTPTRRASRRLLELLVDEAEAAGHVLAPPTLVTPGGLPETLYSCDDAADDLLCQLVRVRMLRDLDEAVLRRLTADPPEEADLRGWWRLAGELSGLVDQLAAEGLSPGDAAAASADGQRWQIIAEVEAACERCLRDQGLVDCHRARRRALETGECVARGPVVVVGVADLSAITRRFLERVAGGVAVLIAAPAEEADAFDAYGGLVTEAWAKRRVAIHDERWIVADRPRDQARAVLDAIADATGQRELSPDAVTVGMGDEGLGSTLQRTLDLAGVPARLAAGQPMLRTRPALLLAAMARYLRSRRFDDFAALLRHPDMPMAVATLPGVEDWLTLLDRYASDHLQRRATGPWLGGRASAMKAVHDAVEALLPEGVDEARPLPAWAPEITAFLLRVYGSQQWRPRIEEDAALVEALTCVRDKIDRLLRIDATGACTPAVPFHGALTLLLEMLEDDTLPAHSGEGPAVELVGFLELPLDDADVVVITGLNEGAIPSSVAADALLPGGLRQKLELGHNDRRLARDVYALTAVMAARGDVTFISGRRSADGDPLAPSRLLLRGDPEVTSERLRRFYDEAPSRPAPPLLRGGITDGPSRFFIPPPLAAATPLRELRVTAFRDYLACPYRFYLKHVLRLEGLTDDVVEMNGGLFGTVAHGVLRRFGLSDLTTETHADTITRFLDSELDREVGGRFGDDPGAAVVLQREQLRERLAMFARWQAEQARAGWRILSQHIECRCEGTLHVDGERFGIRGDIDRIDEHPELGYRVIDYKTSDGGDGPEETHRTGPKAARTWTDLQLPLYSVLAAELGYTGNVELGYVRLPRDLASVGWAPAEWDAATIGDGVATAHDIVRAIRECRFWRPSEPPKFADDFTGVCFDRVTERVAAMSAGDERWRTGESGGSRRDG